MATSARRERKRKRERRPGRWGGRGGGAWVFLAWVRARAGGARSVGTVQRLVRRVLASRSEAWTTKTFHRPSGEAGGVASHFTPRNERASSGAACASAGAAR